MILTVYSTQVLLGIDAIIYTVTPGRALGLYRYRPLKGAEELNAAHNACVTHLLRFEYAFLSPLQEGSFG